MKPIKSVPLFTPVILAGENCEHFIGTVAPIPTNDITNGDVPPGVEFYFFENDAFRDDYPEVEQWCELPELSKICCKCGEVIEEGAVTLATPDGWRFGHFPVCPSVS